MAGTIYDRPNIPEFTEAQHDHSDTENGGDIGAIVGQDQLDAVYAGAGLLDTGDNINFALRRVFQETMSANTTIGVNNYVYRGVWLRLSGNFVATFPSTFYFLDSDLTYDGTKYNWYYFECVKTTATQVVIGQLKLQTNV